MATARKIAASALRSYRRPKPCQSTASGAIFIYMKATTIAALIDAAWEHAPLGRESVERNALLPELWHWLTADQGARHRYRACTSFIPGLDPGRSISAVSDEACASLRLVLMHAPGRCVPFHLKRGDRCAA